MTSANILRNKTTVAALIGLAASLFTLGVAPAGGTQPETRDPVYSTCVGPSLTPVGFLDTGGQETADPFHCFYIYEGLDDISAGVPYGGCCCCQTTSTPF